MFTFIFGFFFGKNSNSGTIGVINSADSPLSVDTVDFLKKTELFNVIDVKDSDEAKDQIKKNKISAAVEIPASFGNESADAATTINLIVDQGNAQVNSIIKGVLNNFLTEINFQKANIKPVFTIKEEKTSDRSFSYFDFVLAGILGMALMNSSIHGISVGMADYREKKILKRITTTPVKTWWFIISEVLSRLILNIFQISLILIIGIKFFDAHVYGSLVNVFLISMLGAILFQLIGFVMASVAKTTAAAEGMATAITIPMMFLSGVFFPIDSLPKWLFNIVQYLPLAPLLRILRGTAIDGYSALENPVNLVIVLTWIILCLIFASFKFRLSEE